MLLWLLGCLGGVLGVSWGAFWDRLERLLGPNLGPKMEPTWAKNRSKNRSFFGCLLESIFAWILVDFGCQNGAKLAPKWDQTSISQKTRKNAFGASPLVPNWVQGVQVGSKNRPKIDPKMESKMECISASIFYTCQWILGSKLGGKMDQKSIQKGIGKRIQKRNDFSMVLEFFRGVSPRPGHPGAEIDRPPKSRFFKRDQAPQG